MTETTQGDIETGMVAGVKVGWLFPPKCWWFSTWCIRINRKELNASICIIYCSQLEQLENKTCFDTKTEHRVFS